MERDLVCGNDVHVYDPLPADQAFAGTPGDAYFHCYFQIMDADISEWHWLPFNGERQTAL